MTPQLFDRPKINFILLIDITLITYFSVLLVGFSSLDDTGMIGALQTGNLTFASLLPAESLTYLRPLTLLTYLIDYRLWGANPVAFHFTNLALHIANVCLVYQLCRSYLPDAKTREGYSFLAALFFAVTPLNSESIIWVSGRTDILCGFFFLLAIAILINNKLSPMVSSVAFFSTYFCSLLAKESSISLIGIASIYLLLPENGKSRQSKIGLYCATTAATVLYLLMRFGSKIQLDNSTSKIASQAMNHPFYELAYKSLATIGFYIRKLLWPYPLNLAIQEINTPVCFIIGCIAIIAFIVFFVNVSAIRLPLLIIFFNLGPPLLAFHGNIPWTLYAERYLYLSMIGMTLLTGFLLIKSYPTPQFLFFLLVIPLAASTTHRSWQWTVPVDLWRDTVCKSPSFPNAHVIYAYELIQTGSISEAEVAINKVRSMNFDNELLKKCADTINNHNSIRSSH